MKLLFALALSINIALSPTISTIVGISNVIETIHDNTPIYRAYQYISNLSNNNTSGLNVANSFNVTPSLNYYSNNTNSFSGSFTLDNSTKNYSTYNYYDGNTNNYSISYVNPTNNYNYVYSPSTNTYNTITNTSNTYYDSYNTYYYEGSDSYYAVTNNYTYQTIVEVPKTNPNTFAVYNYFFQTPQGDNSYNLTVNDVKGIYFNYNIYNYNRTADGDINTLGLWHFNGNKINEVSSDLTINYDSQTFVNGKFDSAMQLSGTYDMTITGTLPNQYSMEFWFLNRVNNGNYSGCGTPNTWIKCDYVYDNGNQYVWFNGVEKTKSSIPYYRHYGDILTRSSYNDYNGYWKFYNSNAYKTSFNYYTQTPYTSANYIGYDYGSTDIFNSHPLGKTNICRVQHYIYTNGSGTYYDQPFVSSSELNADDPYHYAPVLRSNNIEFTFSGTNSHRALAESSCYNDYWHLSATTIKEYLHSSSYTYTYDPDTITVDKQVTYGIDSTCTGYDIDMTNCVIDELRITSGVLWTHGTNHENNIPTDPFSVDYIYTVPTGSTYNVGDIAVMSDISNLVYRVGGVEFAYPVRSNCYIGLSDGYGAYCKVYDGSTWVYCNFSVWNGTEWVDGTTYDFKNQYFGSKDISGNDDTETTINNIYNNYYNQLQDLQDDDSIIDFLKGIPLFFGMLGTLVGVLIPFSPTWIITLFGTFFGLVLALIIYKFIRR